MARVNQDFFNTVCGRIVDRSKVNTEVFDSFQTAFKDVVEDEESCLKEWNSVKKESNIWFDSIDLTDNKSPLFIQICELSKILHVALEMFRFISEEINLRDSDQVKFAYAAAGALVDKVDYIEESINSINIFYWLFVKVVKWFVSFDSASDQIYQEAVFLEAKVKSIENAWIEAEDNEGETVVASHDRKVGFKDELVEKIEKFEIEDGHRFRRTPAQRSGSRSVDIGKVSRKASANRYM